jgi:hypothetical protein
MSLGSVTPEYLQKDELQYELQARGVPTEGSPVYNTVNDLAHAKSLLAPSTHLTAPLPSGSQVQAIPIDDSLTRSGAPCVFAKLPHPIQKCLRIFPSLTVFK